MPFWGCRGRSAALALAVLAIAPAPAAGQAGPEAERRYQQALELMLSRPADPELSFAFVQAAVEVGDLRGAIAALERLLLINPNLANIKLELGLLYLRAGAPQLAEAYISQALDDPGVPETVRARADDLLGQARAASSRHTMRGSLFAGARYETNATAAPGSARVRVLGFEGFLDDENTAREDYSVYGVATLQHRYNLGGQSGDEIETNLLGYGARYDESNEIDTSLFDADIGPRFYIGEALAPALSMRPYLSFSYLQLEDEGYLRTFGGGLNLRRVLSPVLFVEGTAELEDLTYYNSQRRPNASDRSGTLASIAGDVTYQVLANTVVSAGLGFARADADQEFEAFDEGQVRLSLTQYYQAPLGLTTLPWSTSLTGSVRRSVYDAPDPQVDPNVRRSDDRYEIGLSTSVPLTEAVSLVLAVIRTVNDSNLPNDEYRNTLFSLGAGWRF